MRALVAILWVVYLSECLVRWRGGTVVFKEGAHGTCDAPEHPDFELLDGRVGVIGLSPWPWRLAFMAAEGDDQDVRRAREHFARVRRVVTPLVVAATVLFVLLLGGATAVVLLERTSAALVPWGLTTGVAWLSTLGAFFATHAKLHGHRPSLETSLSVLLSPVALVRSPVIVCLRATARTHPVAAAAALCDDDTFLAFARRWSFDRPEERGVVEAAAAAKGLGAALTATPDASDARFASYCPRCHERYGAGATGCADCGGVPLRKPGPSSPHHGAPDRPSCSARSSVPVRSS